MASRQDSAAAAAEGEAALGDQTISKGEEAREAAHLSALSDDAFDMPAPAASWQDEVEESDSPAAPRRPVLPILALALLAVWTGAFVWINRGEANLLPTTAVMLIALWSGPAVLLGMLAYALQMGGTRSALRMGDAARTLRGESLALEERLAAMNRELSLARDFIAAQSRDLDSLGRQTVERLREHGDHLAGLVRDNASGLEVISTVSDAAMGNMERLREHLPVISNSTKDLANNIANTGRVAQAHLQDMVYGLNRLNDFGAASERQVLSLREGVEQTMAELDGRVSQLLGSIDDQFEALDKRSQGFAMDLEKHEEEARDTLRRRSATLNEEIAATRAQLDNEEAESLTSLRARLSGLRDETATVARALRESEASALTEWQAVIERIESQLRDMDGQIEKRTRDQMTQAQALGETARVATARYEALDARLTVIGEGSRASITTMSERMDAMERRLVEADSSVTALTEASVRLLELIQASARYTAQELPASLGQSESRLADYGGRVAALTENMAKARASGEALAEHVTSAEARIANATHALGTLHDGLDDRVAAHGEALASLRAALVVMDRDSEQLGARAQGELASAIKALGEAARQAVTAIEEEGAERVATLATKLGADSASVIERAMRNQSAEIAGQLEQSAAHAAGLAKEAAVQLKLQMGHVDELAGRLERRVSDARARAEEQVDNDFARRVASITETLNSSAIDIAKALDTEVGETAWAAYLRGERGIFTRRAVRLLDNAEAKSVLSTYENDPHFAVEVNRYIHDFEGLLRQLLSTRDGHALGVTLLSSDVGKLYVALAQAIERLRN
ncbi:coiled-coil domain-containing protein [Novosphingobium rosa]|uniref:ATPase n=1 Tax=Novosphingobium rosa TaxID=76978 RepID=UPI0012EE2402|nr:ATPase [Novosphingobium rosa]